MIISGRERCEFNTYVGSKGKTTIGMDSLGFIQSYMYLEI